MAPFALGLERIRPGYTYPKARVFCSVPSNADGRWGEKENAAQHT